MLSPIWRQSFFGARVDEVKCDVVVVCPPTADTLGRTVVNNWCIHTVHSNNCYVVSKLVCSVCCRLEALKWIHFLLVRNEEEVFGQLGTLLGALLDALSAQSERVVLQALSVLNTIADHPTHFRSVLSSLLDR